MFTDGKLLYLRYSRSEEELRELLEHSPDDLDSPGDIAELYPGAGAAEIALLIEKFENKTYTPIPGRKAQRRLVIKHAQILAERADLNMEIREHQDRIAVIIRFEENLFFDDDLYALAELMKMCDDVAFFTDSDGKISLDFRLRTHE